MATLLSKIVNEDIAKYIYKIALQEFLDEKLYILCFNVPWIIKKHEDTFCKDCHYNLLLIISDIKLIFNLINKFNINYLKKYNDFNIKICIDFQTLILNWCYLINNLNKNQQPYIEKTITNLTNLIQNFIQ